MVSSDFISNGSVFDEKVPLGSDGATSLSYKVCKEGRLYFMKQLRPELFTNFGNRALLYKEFALGKSISHSNIVGYHSICENSDELYILMEYVQGCTIEERLENDRGYFMKEHNVWRILLQILSGLKV
ncbi:MAG: protein kinase family protein, partial [Bacteroidaceae bacterium]|nr:protein kinase family protein [Bacteroidaceae bacterium]